MAEASKLVMCNRVEDMPQPPIEGCGRVPCWRCNAACWASPATLASVAGLEWKAECSRCMAGRDPAGVRFRPPTAGQVAEIRRALG